MFGLQLGELWHMDGQTDKQTNKRTDNCQIYIRMLILEIISLVGKSAEDRRPMGTFAEEFLKIGLNLVVWCQKYLGM